MNGQAHMPSGATDQTLPITIVSGYLGAGKTTLINRLLQGGHGIRIAVLVNDFGEINIDADLISDHDGQTISLTNGCVCCSIVGDLGQALGKIAALEPRAEHIIVEASGVADPVRIANYARGQPGICLDATIVLADAETIEDLANDRFVGSTTLRQLSAADLIVITKIDLVTHAKLERVEAWLQQKFPTSPQLLMTGSAVEWDVVIGAFDRDKAKRGSRNQGATQSEHDTDQFQTATWRADLILNRGRTIKVLQSISSDIVRCKGWVQFGDNPEGAELIQMVGRRLEITRDELPEQRRKLALSFIYRKGSLSQSQLDTVMATCQEQRVMSALCPTAPNLDQG